MPLALFNAVGPLELAIILYLLGCGLLVAEVFFPSGGTLGFSAGTAMVAAIYFAYQSGGLRYAATFAAVEVIGAPVVIYFAFQWLPHTPMGRRLMGGAPEPDEVTPDYGRRALLGKIGIARSKMLPSGAVEIDGQMIDAVSRGQAIEPGQPVVVAEVHGNRVVVRLAGEGPERPAASSTADLLNKPLDELGIEGLGIDDFSGDRNRGGDRPP